MTYRGKSKKTLYIQEKVIEVTEELRDYWPLTLRQIYYRLVAAQHIENNQNRYKSLSRICSGMRKQGDLSWAVMEDRTRRVSGKRGLSGIDEFIAVQMGNFLKYYDRCLVQQQENYVELWVEKDALSRIFEEVAWPYCIRVVTCKGQVSTTFLKDYVDRVARFNNKHPVILYAGDLDPSGWRIPRSVRKTLQKDFKLEVTLDRFCLNPDQVEEYQLPNDPTALKWSDSNAKKYVQHFGEIAVELDALNPPILESEIRQSLSKYLDVESMGLEMEIETQEKDKLRSIRQDVIRLIEERGYLRANRDLS